MEILTVSDEIKSKIKLLERMRKEIRDRAITKSQTISEYYKKKTTIIYKLKNGIEIEHEGMMLSNPTATLIKEVIKGLCWQELEAKELAGGLYNALIANIESVQAELNGFQSINRYLDKA